MKGRCHLSLCQTEVLMSILLGESFLLVQLFS